MAGSLRGQNLNQRRPGTTSNIDPDSDERRLGLLLRELRIHSGLTRQEVADEVNLRIPGAGWTPDTVTNLQTGRRELRYREMWVLSYLFNVSLDAVLDTALGDSEIHVTPVVGRLTEDRVVLIRERYAAGASLNALCAEFEVTAGTISRIVNGLTWKSAGGPVVPSRQPPHWDGGQWVWAPGQGPDDV
jgi:Helix-turn-helix domain